MREEELILCPNMCLPRSKRHISKRNIRLPSPTGPKDSLPTQTSSKGASPLHINSPSWTGSYRKPPDSVTAPANKRSSHWLSMLALASTVSPPPPVNRAEIKMAALATGELTLSERAPTSFQRKTPGGRSSRLAVLPGTRPSVRHGQLLLSSGLPSLDDVLGWCQQHFQAHFLSAGLAAAAAAGSLCGQPARGGAGLLRLPRGEFSPSPQRASLPELVLPSGSVRSLSLLRRPCTATRRWDG